MPIPRDDAASPGAGDAAQREAENPAQRDADDPFADLFPDQPPVQVRSGAHTGRSWDDDEPEDGESEPIGSRTDGASAVQATAGLPPPVASGMVPIEVTPAAAAIPAKYTAQRNGASHPREAPGAADTPIGIPTPQECALLLESFRRASQHLDEFRSLFATIMLRNPLPAVNPLFQVVSGNGTSLSDSTNLVPTSGPLVPMTPTATPKMPTLRRMDEVPPSEAEDYQMRVDQEREQRIAQSIPLLDPALLATRPKLAGMVRRSDAAIKRFWSYVVEDRYGHWIWTGQTEYRTGRPIFRRNGALHSPGREAYEIYFEVTLSDDEKIYRTCPEYRCIRPEIPHATPRKPPFRGWRDPYWNTIPNPVTGKLPSPIVRKGDTGYVTRTGVVIGEEVDPTMPLPPPEERLEAIDESQDDTGDLFDAINSDPAHPDDPAPVRLSNGTEYQPRPRRNPGRPRKDGTPAQPRSHPNYVPPPSEDVGELIRQSKALAAARRAQMEQDRVPHGTPAAPASASTSPAPQETALPPVDESDPLSRIKAMLPRLEP